MMNAMQGNAVPGHPSILPPLGPCPTWKRPLKSPCNKGVGGGKRAGQPRHGVLVPGGLKAGAHARGARWLQYESAKCKGVWELAVTRDGASLLGSAPCRGMTCRTSAGARA